MKGVREMAEKGFYEGSVECNNCGEKLRIQIPKGLTVQQFFEEVRIKGIREEPVCPSCGCKTLRAP